MISQPNISWVESVKEKASQFSEKSARCPIRWRPEDPILSSRPSLASYYKKLVLVWAPHLTFTEISLKCTSCGKGLTNDCWAEPRIVHGMTSGI